ncbi:MAG: methylated-DNA--[protein]-cysteine S-methyltransferase [Rhodospirillaceae bacterium]|nr:methylated-DNA--[protein]-cysteine S-methyltransferase [Rhodospirillaceae bacterium]
MSASCLVVPSPFGPLTLFAEDDAVIALDWGQGATTEGTVPDVLNRAKHQLAEYFAKTRRIFDLPFNPTGTVFQNRVWTALSSIPYGETRSYGDLAQDLGTSPRAIGNACGANPIPILIPCHRIIAANGQMGGYSGENGVVTKQALLNLEHAE